MTPTFKTIAKQEEVLFTDKNSKFIAFGYEVYDEEEVKQYLESLRALHPKANHHCYAYRLGLDQFNYRANDDGEPSGSAGKPILGQIDSAALTFTLIVVVRYFGGTKLGVSGLINAYKTAAQMVIEKSGTKELSITKSAQVECSYTEVNDLLNFLKRLGIDNWQQDYTETCKIAFSITESDVETLVSYIDMNSLKLTLKDNF